MKAPLLLVVVFLLVALTLFLFANNQDDATQSSQQDSEANVVEDQPDDDEEPLTSLPNLQDELDVVLGSVRGTHSVLVEDPATGDVLASHRRDEPYFTASIYKLYVAYMGLQDIQAGVYDADELYNQGRTRQECIVAMLRDSDSPCPEQMWEEQGRDTGNQRLSELGLTNTDLLAITTTVRDANTILKRLYLESDLTSDNTTLMRDALRDFPERDFRQGLPSAFAEDDGVVVYNKPGLYDEGWLDAAIVTLPSGREVIVSIYSDAAYYQEVRAITQAIFAPLLDS